ncbi:NAD(P)H-dependent oxidoreductase [Xenorhabdus sp. IM139775]|uniref:NAD(P)H-dependent oxidoreductase n=1 Tax=Xenorhabdus sp. IM139775 TaxID=3025876 RepID=UPI00235855D7|nr:NAD(P)H-dependent oxidoreductase [Xenorhabdus sp. IM139775]MDC9594090.1 NAD(P)H-dependent oxidoreductase [Xenorhabdus sp. IM139775]
MGVLHHQTDSAEIEIQLQQLADKVTALTCPNTHAVKTAIPQLTFCHLEQPTDPIGWLYEPSMEVDKFFWADSIIYQMPGWWMEAPWVLKKYVDEVFSAGRSTLFKDDGRTRHDPARKYGSGGLIQNKTYLFSVTWNAPLESFEDPNQFFEGKGIDSVYYPFHKANQFLGMSPLPTFACYDVIKNPQISQYIKQLKRHLSTFF